jgi:hypothetical protein
MVLWDSFVFTSTIFTCYNQFFEIGF